MKKLVCFLLAAALLLTLGACGKKEASPALVYVDEAPAATPTPRARQDVTILYTARSAGSAPQQYAALSACLNETVNLAPAGCVGLVDCGGAWSGLTESGEDWRGVQLMNYLRYDCAVPGATEFGGGVRELINGANLAEFSYLCANLVEPDSGAQPMAAWTLLSLGGVSVAFVGYTAPETAEPEQLVDAEDGTAYSLRPSDGLYALQEAVDAAREGGAEYVIVLGVCGEEAAAAAIAGTRGVDVFLDGGGDVPLVSETRTDADGAPVLLSRPCGGLNGFGILHIDADGGLWAELVGDYDGRDRDLLDFMASLGWDTSEPEA